MPGGGWAPLELTDALRTPSPTMPRHIRDFYALSRANIWKLISESTQNNKESWEKTSSTTRRFYFFGKTVKFTKSWANNIRTRRWVRDVKPKLRNLKIPELVLPHIHCSVITWVFCSGKSCCHCCVEGAVQGGSAGKLFFSPFLVPFCQSTVDKMKCNLILLFR